MANSVYTGFSWINNHQLLYTADKKGSLYLCVYDIANKTNVCRINLGPADQVRVHDIQTTKRFIYIDVPDEFTGTIGYMDLDKIYKKTTTIADFKWFGGIGVNGFYVINDDQILIELDPIPSVYLYTRKGGMLERSLQINEFASDAIAFHDYYYFTDYASTEGVLKGTKGIVKERMGSNKIESITSGDDYSVALDDMGNVCFRRGRDYGNKAICKRGKDEVVLYQSSNEQVVETLKITRDGKHLAVLLSDQIDDTYPLKILDVIHTR